MWWRQRNRGTRTPQLTRVEAKGKGAWLPLSCWYLSLLGLHQKVEDMELIKIERLIEFTLILECNTVWAINVMRWIGDKKYFLGRSWACVNIGTDSPCWNENTFPPAMHSHFNNFTQSNPWAAWTICSYCLVHSSFCAGLWGLIAFVHSLVWQVLCPALGDAETGGSHNLPARNFKCSCTTEYAFYVASTCLSFFFFFF